MRLRIAVALALLTGLAACGQPTARSPSASPKVSIKPSPSPSPTPAPTPTPPPNLPAIGGIQLPAGFKAYHYAAGLGTTTAMAFGPDGRLYVTSAAGSVAVVPSPGAGAQTLVSGLPTTLGLVWRGTDLFVSVRGGVRGYHLAGSSLAGGDAVVSGLPVGRHQNDIPVLMPNGDFLLGVGSTCDVCNEANAKSASVLRFHSDWSYAGVVVRGTRNPYGLALRKSTGDAFVTVNGQDNLGTQPADHLLRVVDGEDGGWPRCWPSYPDGGLHGSCAGITPPVAVFRPHSSTDAITFYEASEFGQAYVGNAFVTQWGANVGGTVGRRVERVVFTGSGTGERGQVSDFATGFSHPLAITVAPDGGLLVGDYGTGQVVEIFRTG
jgi:glucose/arabinose dehydrogenase